LRTISDRVWGQSSLTTFAWWRSSRRWTYNSCRVPRWRNLQTCCAAHQRTM